jgi:hypothetical protein
LWQPTARSLKAELLAPNVTPRTGPEIPSEKFKACDLLLATLASFAATPAAPAAALIATTPGAPGAPGVPTTSAAVSVAFSAAAPAATATNLSAAWNYASAIRHGKQLKIIEYKEVKRLYLPKRKLDYQF